MIEWRLVDRIGDLVTVLGTPEFGTEFFRLFSAELDADECTAFAFNGELRPAALILEGRCAAMRQSVSQLAGAYVAGAFMRDPNVPKNPVPERPLVHAVSATDFKDPEYRWQFYDEPRLAHELVVIGHARETLYYLSFYRNDRRAVFNRSELDVARRLARVAVRMIDKHRDVGLRQLPSAEPLPAKRAPPMCEVPSSSRAELLGHLREVLLAETCGLSPREAEVCAGIVLGYTTLGISLNFGISLNTVATHRKRAYRKLGICSQNELFSRYFQTVNEKLAANACYSGVS